MKKDERFPKFVVLVNGLVPAALLLYDAARGHGRLGVNPVEFTLRTTGMMALIFLVLSLAVTPVRKVTGWNYLSHFRRMLGLFAFFYGAVHFSCYFAFDRSFNLPSVWQDTKSRPFILQGMTSLLMMVPLALTSTNASVKRLGAVKWKRLHRLAYLAAIMGVLHYYMLVKADTRKPLIFAAILAVLLAYRLAALLLKRRRVTGTAAVAGA